MIRVILVALYIKQLSIVASFYNIRHNTFYEMGCLTTAYNGQQFATLCKKLNKVICIIVKYAQARILLIWVKVRPKTQNYRFVACKLWVFCKRAYNYTLKKLIQNCSPEVMTSQEFTFC